MKKAFQMGWRATLLAVIMISAATAAKASHIFGADLYYTHVSGNTYTITMAFYGDCSGSAFPSLPGNSPQMEIFNNNVLTQTTTLNIQTPTNGVEVSPVCPAQLSSTTCNGGTVPGVKKFVFSRTINLGSTSTNWRFRFTGEMSTSQAGRSNGITNILIGAAGSVMVLEATLNNTGGPNSSPVYTTIPTPFFCINKAASYNPGTVDANNDVLTYSMVPGLDAANGTVTYLNPYTATAPLGATAGTFNFSTTTGQLNFTPNLVQKSLVVNKVEEFRNGVLVGTSMREMTFVVLNNCNNNPPGGTITNAPNATVTGGNTITVCKSNGIVTFNINPTDLDNNVINVSVAGLPSGAVLNIAGNNTTAPIGAFSWNLTTVAPGSYNFFITYTDDGCPLASKQTVAYTIVVLPDPAFNFALITPATCAKKAVFSLTPLAGASPYTFNILSGAAVVLTRTGVTGAITDSLVPGTYTFRIINANNCFKDTIIVIAPPPAIFAAATYTSPTCYLGNNGSITITGSGGLPPFTYAIGAGAYGASNVFSNLTSGSYTLHIKDGNFCIKDTTIFLPDATPISANIDLTRPPCNAFNSGKIVASGFNGTPPYQYALGTGPFTASGTFTGLFSGSYTLHIKDANNCVRDTLIVLPDSVSIHADALVTNILCNGQSTGAITLTAFGTTPPYDYGINGGPLGSINTFTGLPAGPQVFRIEDDQQCYLDTTITLTQPTPITSTSVIVNVSCNGLSDGTVTTTAAGGLAPYTFAIDAGAFGASNVFTGLAAGSHTVHIKDANNCLKDTVVTITQPAVLAITNLAVVTPLCNGNANGNITVTATGGTAPYTYAIGAGAFGASNVFASLTAGNYTLHVKDANNCTDDSVFTLIQPTAITPAAQVKNSTCTTLDDGQVTLSATGGTTPYTYAVGASAFGASPVFGPLTSGTYTFHIKDANNCIKDTIITIIDSINVVGTVAITNAVCFNETSGAISVTPSGGLSPYTFALGAGPYGSSNTFSSILAGTYVLHIKDNQGCIKDTNVNVGQPNVIVPAVAITRPLCFGDANGSITVSATGGTPGYTFALGGGSFQGSGTFNALAVGPYTFHVKDANNCLHDTTVIMTQPAILGISLPKVTNVNCFGEISGGVTAAASGGTPPYSFAADGNPFQASPLITGLDASTHIIRVQDANGCNKDTTITITEPAPLVFTGADITQPTCEGFKDGNVKLQAAGGVSPFSYAIDNGPFGSSPEFKFLPEGTYVFRIRDGHNCEHDTTITLVGYPHIIIADISATPVRCFGLKDGTITLNVTGGVQPLSYQLNEDFPQASPVYDSLKAGFYTIRIKDAQGCYKDTSVSVLSPDNLVANIIVTPNDCEGLDVSGKVTADITGGITPYILLWDNNPALNGIEISGLPNGKHMLEVTDANNCTTTTTASVMYDNCCKPFIPDAFTPNGDGKNDKHHVLFKGDMELLNFSIYNRFGQRVFHTVYTSEGWDGNFNGVPQDLGTYNYYIKAKCGNAGNNIVEFKGTITLIR